MSYIPSAALLAKHAKYLELLPSVQDLDSGFIEFDRCDSLLFSCLTGCVPDVRLNVGYAYDWGLKRWFRRPLALPDCYPAYSTSDISRDQLVGLAFLAWTRKCSAIAESVCDYAIRHFGVMGRGKLSQTLMSPGLLNTFAHISHKLGGKSYPLLRRLPTYISADQTGYQRHLAVLHALLRKKMGLPVNEQIFLKAAYAQPENPLYSFVGGFPHVAEMQLMNVRYWPEDRLPTSADRSAPWLLERDYGPDWRPEIDLASSTSIQYSGGDFLFVSALLQRLI